MTIHNDPNINEQRQWYVKQCDKQQRTMVTMDNYNAKYITITMNNRQWLQQTMTILNTNE